MNTPDIQPFSEIEDPYEWASEVFLKRAELTRVDGRENDVCEYTDIFNDGYGDRLTNFEMGSMEAEGFA